MKNKLFFFLFFIVFAITCLGQNYDTALFKIYYKTSITVDSASHKKENDTYFLSVGHTFSKYYSYSKYLRDSMVREEIRKGNGASFLSNLEALSSSGSPDIVYKDKKSGSVFVTTELVNDKFLIPDNDKISWSIETDTLKIGGYNCQKATTVFHGRIYNAWFTSDIQLQEGPWKFYGLPGLIISVKDSENFFSFEFAGIEKPVSIARMKMATENFVKITMQKYLTQLALYYEDPTAYLKNVAGMNFIIHGESKTPTRKPPLKIELQ